MRNVGELSKAKCYGCGACEQTCHVEAIKMIQDDEGFYYPIINSQICIHCGKCIKVCPSVKEKDINASKPNCFAVCANNKIRIKSSSGGVFTLIAQEILSTKGVVCGAAFNQEFELRHMIIDSAKELDDLRGSKYVQSKIGVIYREIESYLNQGTKVFFVGTPCQVAGLKAYLKAKTENLLTADLVCHGVASQLVFNQYIEENFGKKNIKKFVFRTKEFG